jgi:hypothetical protein
VRNLCKWFDTSSETSSHAFSDSLIQLPATATKGETMRLFTILAGLFLILSSSAAGAVSLKEVISRCGKDGKLYCKGVGYGQPMQTCLSANKQKLSPQCRPVIERLERGEKVGIFG